MGQPAEYLLHYNVGHLYVLSRDLAIDIRNCKDTDSSCPEWEGAEDLRIGTLLHHVAGTRLNWGEWGPRHVVYSADGRSSEDPMFDEPRILRELFTPWVVLVHGMKRYDLYVEAHRLFQGVISGETVVASKKEYFIDHEKSRYFDVD